MLIIEVLLQSTVSLIFLTVSYVLIKQYFFTRAKEYMIFSFGFILTSLTLLVNIILGVSLTQPYDGDLDVDTYVLLIKIVYLRNLIFWSTLFLIAFIGKQRDRGKPVLILFFLYLAFLTLLVLNLQYDVIPETSKIFGLTLYSTLESDQTVITKLADSTIIFGQGYSILLNIFAVSCAGYYSWSLYQISNVFNYEKFNFIKRIWLLFFVSFTIGLSFLVLNSFYKNLDLFPFYAIFQFIAVIGLFIAVIKTPEGLILSKVSMLRVIKNYRTNFTKMDEGSQSSVLKKTLEYIKYVENIWPKKNN